MASRMFSTARKLVVSGAGADQDEAGRRRHLFLKFYERDFSEADRRRILQRLTGEGNDRSASCGYQPRKHEPAGNE